MEPHRKRVAIVGGGPAGLRAAEVAAVEGAEVTVYDAKPSVGRKFLVAGKSGLNLTHATDFETLLSKYSGGDLPIDRWRRCLADFDNTAVRDWARSLGVETFVASGGKVFPESKKAAPLLRRWVLRLRELGVRFEMNQRFVGLRPGPPVHLEFEHGGVVVSGSYNAVVLAMGGASWPQTGSTGTWVESLVRSGVAITPLQPANCGWECAWTPETRAVAEGRPLHHLSVKAGDTVARGELMVTRYGLEGALIYALGRTLRSMSDPVIEIDFKPMFTIEHMVHKMESARRDFFKEARLRWKLTPGACAIIEQQYGIFESAEALARAAKSCRIQLIGPRPIEEAISTSGGVAWHALDDDLQLLGLPGVYCAGEMIDWEAPTGGFLLQGCFATGTRAGRAAGFRADPV